MGMGKGLLDSLIAEGGVKSRDLRKLGIYMGMDIEIRRGRSDRNAAKFYGYPYFTFYLEEIFCTYLLAIAISGEKLDKLCHNIYSVAKLKW